jgi:apolipoprotein N-acyltransferase
VGDPIVFRTPRWVAFEHLVSRVSLNGAFGSFAYTQVDVLPILQVASLAGIGAVTFLVALAPAAVAVALHRRAVRAIVPAAGLTAVVRGAGLRVGQTSRYCQ